MAKRNLRGSKAGKGKTVRVTKGVTYVTSGTPIVTRAKERVPDDLHGLTLDGWTRAVRTVAKDYFAPVTAVANTIVRNLGTHRDHDGTISKRGGKRA